MLTSCSDAYVSRSVDFCCDNDNNNRLVDRLITLPLHMHMGVTISIKSCEMLKNMEIHEQIPMNTEKNMPNKTFKNIG